MHRFYQGEIRTFKLVFFYYYLLSKAFKKRCAKTKKVFVKDTIPKVVCSINRGIVYFRQFRELKIILLQLHNKRHIQNVEI